MGLLLFVVVEVMIFGSKKKSWYFLGFGALLVSQWEGELCKMQTGVKEGDSEGSPMAKESWPTKLKYGTIIFPSSQVLPKKRERKCHYEGHVVLSLLTNQHHNSLASRAVPPKNIHALKKDGVRAVRFANVLIFYGVNTYFSSYGIGYSHTIDHL